jgi:pantoate--beta-alanine ligase
MEILTRIAEVRERVAHWRRGGEQVAFVPTMGNLHSGHISLIDLARQHGQRFVASIFVNPMQFGPNEDFNHYPRTPERDAGMLEQAGCDLMFLPDVGEMYPEGAGRATRVEVPGLSDILCGAFRPGHFEGVATVVAKLFNIVQPDVAVFGEKDYQQLTVIRQMARDLALDVEIVGGALVRDPDGLAMSSRNAYLSADDRARALSLSRGLAAAAALHAAGTRDAVALVAAARAPLEAAGLVPEYLDLRAADDLRPLDRADVPAVLLVAARVGSTRLIDNQKLG